MACVWLVETVSKKHQGIIETIADNTHGALEITFNTPTTDLPALANSLQKLGYEILPEKLGSSTASSSPLVVRLGICGALAINTMAFTLPRYTGMETSHELHNLLTAIAIASSTLTMLIGGSYFFKRAWSALRLGGIHMDLPISIGLIIAYLGSLAGWFTGHEDLFYFDFVAIFTFLMILGKHVQLTSLNRASHKFQNNTSTPTSYKTTNPDTPTIPTTEIPANTTIIIPPGTVIPADSRLLETTADLSLAWLTGEPTSILYHHTDPIPAGAVNQTATSIKVETTTPTSKTSSIGKLITSTNTPQADRQAHQKSIQIYLATILIIGALASTTWLITTQDWVKSLQVLISIYVISCPCGIGLALPLLDTKTSKTAQNHGIFTLTQRLWDHLTKIQKIVFDKTGTLTLDKPTLISTQPIDDLTETEKQTLLTLTRASLHPLSRSLFSSLINSGTTHSLITAPVTETPGQGTFITLKNNDTYHLGRPTEAQHHLTCTLTKNKKTIANFQFQETPRTAAAKSIKKLNLPSPPMILSGDESARVASLAKKLNIPEHHGNLSPEQKQQIIANLEKTKPTLYIGDGINDLPALQTATLAGAPFANINMLTAEVDFLFTDDTLAFLPTLFLLTKRRNTLKRRLITYTIAYNAIVLAIATAGLMSPLIAAIIMPLSSLISIAIINAKWNKHSI